MLIFAIYIKSQIIEYAKIISSVISYHKLVKWRKMTDALEMLQISPKLHKLCDAQKTRTYGLPEVPLWQTEISLGSPWGKMLDPR